jgi:ribosomal protein S18 acetylase RimI-like enzyme
MDNLMVRNMTREECGLAVEWAAQEGWNPGLHDAECFYRADPAGFFIALQGGEPVGCLSAVAYDEHFGFAGFYIVRPGWRGQNISHHLVRRAQAYLGNRTVGNDAVVAQQETYKQLGFHLAYRNIRYSGTAGGDGGLTPELLPLHRIPFNELAAYDRLLFPADRSGFLGCWISQPESTALGYENKGKLSGYGVIRKCREGHKIGPLFAENEAIAERLFLALTGNIAGETFFLDIPEPNPAAGRLVERYGMQKVFETARMYSGEAPALPVEKIFGVTSFELG